MKAVVFHEGSHWQVEDVPSPSADAGQVVLRVLLTGVCGTDEHLLHGGFIAKLPLIPGHEIVGEVIEVGEGVYSVRVGDRVAVDNAVHCGVCTQCTSSNSLFCENFVSLGCNAAGGFAEYVSAPAHKVYDVGGLSSELAVLTEPLACVVHGMDILEPPPGARALVFGAGPTALLFAQTLRMSGAATVTVAAPTQSKLGVAKNMGIEHTVQLERGRPDLSRNELESISPSGFDVVIEATGAIELLEISPSFTRIGGTVMVFGVAPEGAVAQFSPYEIFSRELTIKGSYAQAHCFQRALTILKSGRISNEGMITSRVGFDNFGSAITNLHDSSKVKTVFDPAS